MREARVKIVATIGPASRDPRRLAALAAAGVDVFRVNGAHELAASFPALVRDVREAGRRTGHVVALLVDLPGIKTRIGALPERVELRRGALVALGLERAAARSRAGRVYLPVSRATLAALRPRAEAILGDGAVTLRVVSHGPRWALARVLDGGAASGHQGIHVRGAPRAGRVPTAEDVRIARAAVRAGADALALSFVEEPKDVAALRRAIGPHRGRAPLVIAKIERRAAVSALDRLLGVVDGVMVARGDLALEYAPEDVPPLQKRILEASARAARFAITATQMLESMTHERRPTRAEASDVANAVFDGTDAVMLSAETAVGVHPARVVATMERILRAAEADPHTPFAGERGRGHAWPVANESRPDRLVVRSAVRLATEAGAAAVVVFTRGGQSARRLAKERPRAPIYAYAASDAVVRGLAISWGVRPRPMPAGKTTDDVIRAVVRRLRGEGLAPGSRVVLVMGGARDPAATTSLVKLLTV